MTAPTISVEPTLDHPAPAPGGNPSGATEAAGRARRWRGWLRWPRANPVLRRELRVRMRGRRAFIVLGVYLLLLGLVAYATEQVLVHADSNVQLQSFQVGQILFAGLAIFEVTVLIFVAPALTATAISAERERGTFELLRATPVRPHTLVWGKLLAALSYAALLIVASIPMASAVFLFGGVAPADVWATFALLGVTTLAFGMLGLFCSAVARRSGLAAVLAYGTAALLVVGTIGLYVFMDAVDGGLVDRPFAAPVPDMGMQNVGVAVAADGSAATEPDEPPRLLLALNPVLSMASLVGDAVDESPADPWTGQTGGIPVFGDWLEFLRAGDADFGPRPQFVALGPGPFQAQSVDGRPLWHLTAAVYGGATVVLFLATVWVVGRAAGQRFRWPRPRLRRWRRTSATAA